jgi:hypothetical protein
VFASTLIADPARDAYVAIKVKVGFQGAGVSREAVDHHVTQLVAILTQEGDEVLGGIPFV